MMGFLDLIHTEPYPETNLGKPFLDKPRGLEEKSNYIVIKYKDDTTFTSKGTDGITYKMDGIEISEGTVVTAGTKIEIHLSSPKETMEYFFKDNLPNSEKITLIDFSKFDSSNLKYISYLFDS